MMRFTMTRSHWVILLILAIAIAERVLWNGLRPTMGAEGEAFNVARALAEGRGFADAYRVGSGPTAHLTPVTPLFAGGVYALFGIRSLVSECILATWSIGLALATYLLLYRAFYWIGVPSPLRLIALAWGCLAPTYLSQEAVDFRVWEGGFATFLVALFLDRLLRAVSVGDDRSRTAITLAVIGGMLFFVNPPMGLGAIGCLALFALRHLSLTTALAAAGAGAMVIALLVTPWAIRNAHVLGTPVLLRSNAGLELALSNYPGAERVTDDRGAYLSRINAIHPTVSDSGYRRMRAIGEVAYSRDLGTIAMDWIEQHPARALSQALSHMGEMFVPSAWKFDPLGESRTSWIKVPLAQFVGVVGLIGMIVAVARLGMSAAYPIVYVAGVVLLISPFQPVVRYMYVISPVLVNFMACAGLLLPRFGKRAGGGRVVTDLP